jgi:hypothetical protein
MLHSCGLNARKVFLNKKRGLSRCETALFGFWQFGGENPLNTSGVPP